jgi:competence protein ComEC
MCAAIRLNFENNSKIFLGGDFDFCCLDYCTEENIDISADVIIFPHHGGLPSTGSKTRIETFVDDIVKYINPKYFIFSIHQKQYSLPHKEIIEQIGNKVSNPRFLCTQLPVEYINKVLSENPGAWEMHCKIEQGQKTHIDGNINIQLTSESCFLKFLD